MFGGLFTPGIVPQQQQAPQQTPQQPASSGLAAFAQSPQRKGLFGGNFNNVLGGLGAALKDIGNAGESDHLGAFQKQQQQFAEQARQQAALQALSLIHI